MNFYTYFNCNTQQVGGENNKCEGHSSAEPSKFIEINSSLL